MIYTVTLNPSLDKEYSVPKLETNTVLRASAINHHYGGKGINVSRMLKSLGTESIALGFVGGPIGKSLRDGLEGMGIKTNFVEVSGETRVNISIVNDTGEDYIKVNETGPTISLEETTRLIDIIKRLVQPGDLWILAGGLPPGIQSNFYAQIINLINTGGAKAFLDSSGESLRIGCKSSPFLIKPNIEEAAQITGLKIASPKMIVTAIKKMHQMGVKNIILSAGKDNSILSTGERYWEGIPPKINEKNPTGAGDAMLAAVVYRLEQGDQISDAFAWGLASGSAAASLPGTEMASRSTVEKLLKQVVITEE